jgi:hypothetical protein
LLQLRPSHRAFKAQPIGVPRRASVAVSHGTRVVIRRLKDVEDPESHRVFYFPYLGTVSGLPLGTTMKATMRTGASGLAEPNVE